MLDPVYVLNTVSAVCQRWQRLALDPGLWGRVSLCYTEVTDRTWTPATRPQDICEEPVLLLRIRDRKNAATLESVLRRVPCLLRLQLHLKQRPPAAVESALRAANRPALHSLAVLGVHSKYVTPLLEAHRGSLRAIEWWMPARDTLQDGPEAEDVEEEEMNEDFDDPDEDSDESEEDGAPSRRRELLGKFGQQKQRTIAVWRLMASMPKLTELVMNCAFPSMGWMGMLELDRHTPPGRNRNPPPAMQAKLVKFRVMGPVSEDEEDWQTQAMWPLLARSTATLRDVELRLEPARIGPLLQCAGLRRVVVPLLDGLHRLADACPLLEDVTLLGNDEDTLLQDLEEDSEDRKSYRFLRACAAKGLPLRSLSLEAFPKYFFQNMFDELLGLFTDLRVLRLIRCDIRGCDGTWYQLIRSVKLMPLLERLEIGHASWIPRGALTRLGAEMPASVAWLRLDGFGYQECDRLERELRAVVASRPGLHVAVTQPNVSGCGLRELCDSQHGGVCDARLIVHHRGRKRGPAAAKECRLCKPALGFRRHSVEEVREVQAADDEEMDVDGDLDEDDEDGERSFCCEMHSEYD